MKRCLIVFVVLLFGLLFTAGIFAQDSSSSSEAAADLRARLVEVQAREGHLQSRLNQVNEDLKPENIERAFAGIGSTRPEELREQRRKELSIESDGVRKQLELLATSRTRLASAIQFADNRAYQQSAQSFSANQFGAIPIYSIVPRVATVFVISFAVISFLALIACIRRPE